MLGIPAHGLPGGWDSGARRPRVPHEEAAYSLPVQHAAAAPGKFYSPLSLIVVLAFLTPEYRAAANI